MQKLTIGQKAADKIAAFGGSWKFISCFAILLSVWMYFNVEATKPQIFDPYPFILLNLILSCLAAIQAPVIMMSNNRASEIDRARAIETLKTMQRIEALLKSNSLLNPCI